MKLVSDNSEKVRQTSLLTIDEESSVLEQVKVKIQELSYLANGWDSYRAIAPTKQALLGALSLCYDIIDAYTPMPDIFPVPNGNIQIEWSCYDIDVEIEVLSQNLFHVFYEDLTSGETREFQVDYDLGDLTAILYEIRKRQRRGGLEVVNG